MSLVTRWRWFKREIKKTNGRMWFLTLFCSFILLIGAFVLLIYAGHYLNLKFGHLPPLPDLGHQILPLWDVRFLTQIGLFVSLILFVIGALNEPHRMPYFFLIASFWFLIRIASMTVTPMGGPADFLPDYSKKIDIQSLWDIVMASLSSPNVLFFSGHTGLPFLGYLIFRKTISYGVLIWPMLFITLFYLFSGFSYSFWMWGIVIFIWIRIIFKRKKPLPLGNLFLIWSFIMGASVLLTRNHYSIDVLGAYFMTAGIFFLGRALFKKIEQICEAMEPDFSKTED